MVARMPLYEYECQSCHQVVEILQKISDPHPDTCPQCSSGPLKKLISQTNFVLKGGGWYTDAYSSKTTAPNSSDDQPKTEKKSDTASASEPKKAKKDSTPSPSKKDD